MPRRASSLIALVIVSLFAATSIGTVSASNPNHQFDAAAVAVSSVSTASTSCDGHRRNDIRATPNVWRTVGYTNSRRVLNFWTNSPGHSQKSFKVKIPKGTHIKVKGGGSLWTFSCSHGWNSSYARNPLKGHSISWMIKHGLAKRLN